MKLPLSLVVLIAFMSMSACTKKTESATLPNVALQVAYTYTAATGAIITIGSPFTVGEGEAAHSLTLRQASLYVSNIALIRADGTEWLEADSYHLLRLPAAGSTGKGAFTIRNVPQASFTHLRFSFGIDSAANHNLDHHSDLDPSNGTAWDWNTGYKFLILEGSLNLGAAGDSGLVWHLGSDSNYRTRTLTLNKALQAQDNAQSDLSLLIPIGEFFTTPNPMAAPQNRNVMFDSLTTNQAADNVSSALRFSVPD